MAIDRASGRRDYLNWNPERAYRRTGRAYRALGIHDPLRAFSFGLPAISSRVGATHEAVEDGHTGLLVAPGDVDALATAMEGLATDRALSMRMGGAARAAFLARFTLERFRCEVGRVYREALQGRCAAS